MSSGEAAGANPPPTGSRGLSRWLYYASSLPTLFFGMRGRARIGALFLGLPVRRPIEVGLPGGVRFRVRTPMEVWTLKETCLDRDYERGAVAVADGWTVIDLGAAFGDFAVRVARECPAALVHAYEPLPESFSLLSQNLALNAVTNVRLFREAVSSSAGTLRLFTTAGPYGQHRSVPGAAPEGLETVEVPAITLEQALARMPQGRCDFLKIDCEGAEFDILLSMSEEALSRIGHIALEYHDAHTPHRHQELVAFLSARGFEVHTRPNPVWRELGFLFASGRPSTSTVP